jgi:SM-20-related protein
VAIRDAAFTAVNIAPEISPALDSALFAARFREKSRVHIPGVLTPESAMRLYECLHGQTPWTTVLSLGTDIRNAGRLSGQDRQKFALGAWERARRVPQFFFDHHVLSRGGVACPQPTHDLAQLAEFLNAPAFLALVRQLAGLDVSLHTDAEATFFHPGDFDTLHDGRQLGGQGGIGFSLCFTPGWRPHWGGTLQFFAPSGHLEEGFLPGFNTLDVYRVESIYSVSPVATYGGFRYAIEGRLH